MEADPPTSARTGLTLERQGPLATLYLDAPPKNLTDVRLFEELGRLARQVLPSLSVEGLVVRGRGRHFSAGANLDELASLTSPDRLPAGRQRLLENVEVLTRLESLPYPVAALIDGSCLGSGLELALACRFRVATPTAVLGLPESSFGLMPGCGATVRLPRLVGVGQALQLILTGRLVTGDEARLLGLVDAVVEKPALDEAASRLFARFSVSSLKPQGALA